MELRFRRMDPARPRGSRTYKPSSDRYDVCHRCKLFLHIAYSLVAYATIVSEGPARSGATAASICEVQN